MGSSGSHGRGAPGRLLPGLVVAISLGSVSLGAMLAASAVGRAAESPTPRPAMPGPADEQPVTRPSAPAGEAFPSLGRAPERPVPTMSPEERRRLTDSLIGDRENARYTNEQLRGGLEPEAAAPRSLPPLSPEEQKRVAEERQHQRETARLDAQSQEPVAATVGGLPQPLPADEEARSYSARTIPNGGGRLSARVPGPVIAREYRQTGGGGLSADAGQTEAPGLDASGQKVLPLRMPPTVATLPAPGGGSAQPNAVAAIPQPTVVSSLANPVAARPVRQQGGPVAIPQAPQIAGLVPVPGNGAVPVLRMQQPAAVAMAVPVVPAAPGVVVNSTYEAGLAASRQVRLTSSIVPQFRASTVPSLPASIAVPMTPAMQAALSGTGSTAGLPVIPTVPQDLGQRAAGSIPGYVTPATVQQPRAPSRYDVAIGAASPAGGSTAIDFAAGSSRLDASGREAVHRLAAQVAATAGQVLVIGYARAAGDAGDPVNAFGVSIDRANKVAAELMAAGVPPRQVRVEAAVADGTRNGAAGRQAVIVVE